ncbi:MAG: hypothetical protein AB1758_03090, partial [Candidatus Eremiobacterota bacterium]
TGADPYSGPDAVACPSCGGANGPGQVICSACQEPLASFDPSDDADGELVSVPSAYQPLFQACHAVASGQTDLDAWWAEVVFLSRVLSATRESVDRHAAAVTPELWEQNPALEQSTLALRAGLEDALAALEGMSAYLDEDDPELLNRGWMDLLKATGAIQSAGAAFAERPTEESPA